jgi:hypothetical protein
MYLSATTHILEILSDATATTNEPVYSVAYNDHTSAGMTLPQSSSQGLLTGTTPVTAVSAPGASTTRQIAHLTVYNADTVTRIITVQKDVSATNYIVVKASLASGATLQFSRENGWTVLNTGAGQESLVLTQFIASGTWNKSATLKAALVCCLGAGGGGGSGRQGAAGENRFGGNGGGGGAMSWRVFQASSMSSSYAITVGTGGGGAGGQASTSSNGNTGTTGGDSSFGSAVIAKGGSGGVGGTTSQQTQTSGGLSSGSSPALGPYSIDGGVGVAGQTTSSSSNTNYGLNGRYGGAGGASGQGISSANVSGVAASTGAGVYANGTLVAGPATGVAGASNQSLNFMFSTSLSAVYGLGTGGAGGVPANIAGTAGGSYGAGGGGGSGTLNGTTSGAGGAGAGGLVTVLEIY